MWLNNDGSISHGTMEHWTKSFFLFLKDTYFARNLGIRSVSSFEMFLSFVDWYLRLQNPAAKSSHHFAKKKNDDFYLIFSPLNELHTSVRPLLSYWKKALCVARVCWFGSYIITLNHDQSENSYFFFRKTLWTVYSVSFFALVNCCQLFLTSFFCWTLFIRLWWFFYSKEQLEMKLLYAINADAGFDLSWLTYQLCDCMLKWRNLSSVKFNPCFWCFIASRLEASMTVKASESKKIIKGWGRG